MRLEFRDYKVIIKVALYERLLRYTKSVEVDPPELLAGAVTIRKSTLSTSLSSANYVPYRDLCS